jgi:large subunit ribosomal protein L29
MKASQLKDLNREELLQKEQELTEELFNLKFQHATGQLENVMRVKATKRDIARVKTVLNQRREG